MKDLHTYIPQHPRGRYEKIRPFGYKLTALYRHFSALKLAKQRKAVFIRVPKTGGTSINKALAEIGCRDFKRIDQIKYRFTQQGPASFSHMDYLKLVEEGFVSPDFNENAFKFTIVRNPYSRLVSLFSYYKKFGDLHQKTSFKTFCHLLQDGAIDEIGLFNVNGMSQCQPQTRWLTDQDEQLFIDYVGRFENLEESFKHIIQELGLNTKLPKVNSTKHSPYQEYYDDETLTIVQEYYKKDFDILNYSTDLEIEN